LTSARPLIRPFEVADAEPVAQLLQTLWGHDPVRLSLYSIHKDWRDLASRQHLIRLTLVAVVGGDIVGVGTLFESTYHPLMLNVVINVRPDRQRQGIGTALYRALREAADGRPWTVRLTLRDPAGTGFFARHGFSVLVRTMMGLLDPHEKPVREWMVSLPTAPEGFNIERLDPGTGKVPVEEIALFHAEIYRQFHLWNPPAEFSVERATALFCGEDRIEGSQLGAFEGRKLVGAANLIRNPFDVSRQEAYLVHVGVAERDVSGPLAHMLTAALIRSSLLFADDHELKVRFEADSTFVPHWAIFELSPAAQLDADSVLMADTWGEI
jgi:predicted N-acetyltransferase YhbS